MELIVRGIACLAEGVGIRGTARGFAIDLHTMLRGLGAAAEHLHSFSVYFPPASHRTQGQRDDLDAVRRAVRDGDGSAVEAIERLSRSPHRVWTAIAPETKWLRRVQVGDRTRAMTQAILPQSAQR